MPDVSKRKKFNELKDFMAKRVLKHREYFEKNNSIFCFFIAQIIESKQLRSSSRHF